MFKDTNLSTILLFITVGILIYCLMKPKEGFANEPTKSDVSNPVPTNPVPTNPMPSSSVSSSLMPSNSMAGTEISNDLITQVLAESENKMGVSKSNVPNGSVLDYLPHDNDETVGASLDSAFDKPIQEGVKTDVVDLNRNNVKNYNAKDYLPKEVNDDWFNTDFSQAKYKMNDDKLINTEKYVVGVNTVGQSLKNASYDIRGAVNVPKYSVSPWNNSTTEPDYNIKPLC